MFDNVFEELKHYIGFSAEDERALREMHPRVSSDFVPIADIFYRRILDHEGAKTALVGGESTVGRLKVTLVQWMNELFLGPWDLAYFERRCRIGRMHVKIALPQHYMFGAMNVVRRELNVRIDREYSRELKKLAAIRSALGKILDLELAIMLHTYREDLLAQQARTERLSTFGQLVGSIGHELRNPLGVIETSLFILKGRTNEDERAKKHVDRIGEQVQIANQIITDLLDMIRDRPLARERFSISEVIESARSVVRHPPEVAVEVDLAPGLAPVEGDKGQLRQAILNLMENAVYAASPAGRVKVLVTTEEKFLKIAVEDSGKGVDDAVARRLFEPLITTKEKGIGLGLALVKRIAERHGGAVRYERADLGGARFVLRLPCAAT